jgi:hypothetical protein
MCQLFSLPRDMFFNIANYFLEGEDQNKAVFKFPLEWRNLMNTNQEHFAQWKKESRLLVLFSGAETFYTSPEFRAKILRLVVNPQLQLDIILDYESCQTKSSSPQINLQILNNIRKLYLSGVEENLYVPAGVTLNIAEITLFGCPCEDLSCWSNVKSVTFWSHGTVTAIPDLAPIRNIERASFHLNNCINYQALGNLKSLKFAHCDSITDVTCFRNISTLSLTGCRNISDVSPLSSVYDLNLSDCQGITDVSTLGKVYKLNLRNCQNIADVSSLGNVHSLILSQCTQLKNLSALTNVVYFRFEGYNGTDLSGLKAVTILDISHSPNVSDVRMLLSLRELNITGCANILDVKGLTRLRKLQVSGNNFIPNGIETIPKLSNLEVVTPSFNIHDDVWTESSFLLSLRNIQELYFRKCRSLCSLPSLPHLRSLTVISCVNFQCLALLPCLGYLEITQCVGLCVLHIPGDKGNCQYPIYSMLLDECEGLEAVHSNRAIFKCIIERCNRLKYLEFKERIGHFRIDSASAKAVRNIEGILQNFS